MNSMLRQHHIRLQDLSNYLRGYDPAKPQAPEEWSKTESQGFQPGMLIFCMDAVANPPGLTLGKKAEDHGETYRVKDLCVVVGEDNGKALVVNITASAYELRFLEVLLLEKARKAILDGRDFHYVVVRPSQELDEATKRGLDQLGNLYAQGGSRRSLVVDNSAGAPQEPAMALLSALGVKLQMTGIGKQVLDIGSICHMLFAPEGRQEDKNKVLVKACFTPIANTEQIGYGNGHPPAAVQAMQAPEQAAAWNEFEESPPAAQQQWPEQAQDWSGPDEMQAEQGWTQEQVQQSWPQEQQPQGQPEQQSWPQEQHEQQAWSQEQHEQQAWPQEQAQSWTEEHEEQQAQSGNWQQQQAVSQQPNWPEQPPAAQQQSGNWPAPEQPGDWPQAQDEKPAQQQWQQQTQSGGWPQQATSGEWQPETTSQAGSPWQQETNGEQTAGEAWPPDQAAQWSPGAPAEAWAQPEQPDWTPPPEGSQGSWPDQISGEWPQTPTEDWQPGTQQAESEWNQPEAQAGFAEYEQPVSAATHIEPHHDEEPVEAHDYTTDYKEPEYSQPSGDFGKATDFTDSSQFQPEGPPEAPPNAFAQASDQSGWYQQPQVSAKRSTFGFDIPSQGEKVPFGAPQQPATEQPVAFPPPGPEPSADPFGQPAQPDFAEQFKRDFEQGMTAPTPPADLVPRQKSIDEEFNEVIFGTAAPSTMDVPQETSTPSIADDEWTTTERQDVVTGPERSLSEETAAQSPQNDDGWTSQPGSGQQPERDRWASETQADATRPGDFTSGSSEFNSRAAEFSLPASQPVAPPPPLPSVPPPLPSQQLPTAGGDSTDNLTLFERLNQKLSKAPELQPAETPQPPQQDDGSYKHLAEALSGLMHSDRPADSGTILPDAQTSAPPAPPLPQTGSQPVSALSPETPRPLPLPVAETAIVTPPPLPEEDFPAAEPDTTFGTSTESRTAVPSSDTWMSRAGAKPDTMSGATAEPAQSAPSEVAPAQSTQPYWTTPTPPQSPESSTASAPIITPPSPPLPVPSAPIITPPPAEALGAPIITPPPAEAPGAPIITPPPAVNAPIITPPPAPVAAASSTASSSTETAPVSVPKSPSAGFQEPRAVMNEMATLMSKLEQQVAKAAKKLSSRAEEIKARLTKQIETALQEAAHSERQTDASLGTLSTRLTKELEDVSEEVRLKISDVAANGRYTIKQLYTTGQGQLEETKNELYESLREACKQFRTDTENLTRDTEMQLHKLINQRMDELHELVDTICERLDDTGDMFVDKLTARFERFRERMADESDAVTTSLERSARSMNEEIESAWERVIDKLKSSHGDFDATVNHHVRTAELIISQNARKHMSELLLPKLRERKDVFRGMTTEMTRRFTEESESQVRGQMLNLEANLSAARQQLQNLAQECMASIDAVGRGQQAGLEETFKDTSNYVEKTTGEVMLLLQNTEKQITDAEVTCKKLAETSSVDADPRLTDERNQGHSRVQQLKQQSQSELAMSIENGCGRLEHISQELHNQLAAERVDHTRAVRESAENGLSQIREAIQETFNAIQAAREKYME